MTGLAAFVGLILAGYLYTGRDPDPAPRFVRLAFGHLIGTATIAFAATAGLSATGGVHERWGWVALVGLAAHGARRGRRAVPPPVAVRLDRVEIVIATLIGLGILHLILRLAVLGLEWDGYAIWQLKAKALVVGDLTGLLTSPLFSYAHPDYPLLVPMHTWWLSGGEFGEKKAQCASFLFVLDLLAIVYHEIRHRAGRRYALFGVFLMLASWRPLWFHAGSGFADVPAATYAVAVAAALARGRVMALAPLLVGALLTKNEGLFTLAGALVGAAILHRRPLSLDHRRVLQVVVVAGATGLGSWGAVKWRFHLAGDVLSAENLSRVTVHGAASRVAPIARALFEQVRSIGAEYPGWGLLWLLAIFAALAAWGRPRTDTLAFGTVAAAHVAGAVAAYLVTPQDLAWHMRTSMDRLLLQAAPAALVATLVALATLAGGRLRPVAGGEGWRRT